MGNSRKTGEKARTGVKVVFGEGELRGEIIGVQEDGNRRIRFSYEGIFEEILDRLGQMPLPPYITHKLEDKNRYQTVYARYDGSAAAPTAGLHFTEELFRELEEKGVLVANVTLHVGLGTFLLVKVEDVAEHHMHSEHYFIEPEEAEKINQAKTEGGSSVWELPAAVPLSPRRMRTVFCGFQKRIRRSLFIPVTVFVSWMN